MTIVAQYNIDFLSKPAVTSNSKSDGNLKKFTLFYNKNYNTSAELAEYILSRPVELDQFSIYEIIIDQLVYQQEFDLANSYLHTLTGQDLRERYRERLQEQKEWLGFLSEIE